MDTFTELKLRIDFESWCRDNKISVQWLEEKQCYTGSTVDVLKAWARGHDYLKKFFKIQEGLVQDCLSLVKDRPYTFRCINAPRLGLPTYEILFRGEAISTSIIDASNIERLIALMNGAYTMGINDSCGLINTSFNVEDFKKV